MKTALVIPVMLSFALAGCSKPAAPPAAPAAASQPAPPKRAETITKENQGILTDTQRDALNGANQVSGVLKKAEEDRQKQMKEQGL
jgi:hypothetical protein